MADTTLSQIREDSKAELVRRAEADSAQRFIKRPAVEDMTGLSCSEIYRRIAAGTFPKQIILGPKSVAWIEAEVRAWQQARIAENRGEIA